MDDQTLSEYFIAVGDLSTGALVQLSSALADEEQAPPHLDRTKITTAVARPPARPLPFSVDAQSGSGTWRLVAVAHGGDRVAVVGLSLDQLESTLDQIRLVQVLGTLAVLATLGLVSWWMLRLGVHPIEDMARTADAIAQRETSLAVSSTPAATPRSVAWDRLSTPCSTGSRSPSGPARPQRPECGASRLTPRTSSVPRSPRSWVTRNFGGRGAT